MEEIMELANKKSNQSKVEEVKRLAPTGETLRRLFLHSGNLCAYPGCGKLMMNAEGVFIGQVCHIEAAEQNGERFNADMTNEKRRQFDNLMLMCYEHHQVTNDIIQYPVSKLQQIKAEHEKRFSDPERAILEQLTDWTERSTSSVPTNLGSINKVLGWDASDEELVQSLSELTGYLNKLRNVPLELRRFLGAVIKRAWKMKDENVVRESINGGVEILASDIERAFCLSRHAVAELVSSLEAYRMMTIGEIDTGLRLEASLVIPAFPSGWPFWSDIAKFCELQALSLEIFSVDMDFARLGD